MNFEDAKRTATPVVVSLAGRSGSGKTLSALYMARGLAGPDGKVYVIDTENKRSLIYAEDPVVGGFKSGHLYPPFTPDAYIAAIEAAEAAGADVIVIDSMSHEWSGVGGCLEWAASLDPTGKKGPAAWVKPKAAHRRMVNRLLLARCHLIVCLRAEFKMVAFTDPDGKQQFAESAELIPEQEKRFVYEMTASAVIDHDTHKARWVKLPKPLIGQLVDGASIDPATGEAVKAWVEGGAAMDRETERHLALCREAALQGREALRDHYTALMPETRAKLKPYVEELRQSADQADKLAEGAEPEEAPKAEPEDNPFGLPATTPDTPLGDEWEEEFRALESGLAECRTKDAANGYLDDNASRIRSMCARQDLSDRWVAAVDRTFEAWAA